MDLSMVSGSSRIKNSITLILTLTILDVLSTWLVLSSGKGVEVNPLYHMLGDRLWMMAGFKIAIMSAVCLMLLSDRYDEYTRLKISFGIVLLLGYIVLSNL